VAALTRQHVTVSLSGDAGDELFGGYRRYVRGPALWRSITRLPPPARRAASRMFGAVRQLPGLAAAGRVVRPMTGKRGLADRLRQAEQILAVPSEAAYYDYLMSYWKHPREVVLGAGAVTRARVSDGWMGAAAPEAMMATDLVTYLPDDILVKVDRASMGVSLESRIPLLDHRVIELAARLPLPLKIRDGQGKWVLRQVLDRYVPRQLVERPKHGFDAPVGAWLRGPLREWADALLAEDRLRAEGFFQPAPITRKWREHLADVTSWDYDLWAILMFQAWHEAWGQAAPRAAVTVG
jgi:asparagine synthase (glutamine-hydrolysing)